MAGRGRAQIVGKWRHADHIVASVAFSAASVVARGGPCVASIGTFGAVGARIEEVVACAGPASTATITSLGDSLGGEGGASGQPLLRLPRPNPGRTWQDW